jgi:hypothetical protein
MTTAAIFSQEVTANIAQYDICGAQPDGVDLVDFAIRIKTHTPSAVPGAGVLRCTISYNNGLGTDLLQVACVLDADGVSVQRWSVWWDQNDPVTLELDYIGVGGETGTADVTILLDAG